MKTKKFKKDLLKELRNPQFAAEYLAQVMAEQDYDAFLIALKDVVEATGGVGALAKEVNLQRQSLYKILSGDGNPRLSTLQEILKPLGLQLSIDVA
jgi:probable addiction module antidote protein